MQRFLKYTALTSHDRTRLEIQCIFYFIGMFRRKADADLAIAKVRAEGSSQLSEELVTRALAFKEAVQEAGMIKIV